MILKRSDFERWEEEYMAPYAMKSAESRGRAFPEDEHPYRAIYQRDRDRIIHTTAFRRLEYKTQVFIITEGDYYRTRLTHTLEVAQIGRTIARALRANEDLTEAICLVHDLGHGPFGHNGEETLNDLMRDSGGYDHNRQAYRIVEKLEHRYPDFNGLNLTYEVLEGILKHESEYDRSDALNYEPDLRGTIECQIVNVADEIAYTTADFDDGLRSGMITPYQVSGLTIYAEVLDELGIKASGIISEMDRHRLIRRLVGKEVSDVITATEAELQQRRTSSVAEVRRYDKNIVNFSDEMAQRNRVLKDFLYENLYRHYRVVRMARKAENIIRRLFEAYVNTPAQLPQAVQSRLKEEDSRRVICDYIAGMTDRFAIQDYQKLFNPDTLP
jgi:dGTPase